MTCCFAKSTLLRMFDGSIRQIQDIKQGEQLMGDDNSPRRVEQVTPTKCKAMRIKYQSYLDSSYDKEVICSYNAVLPVIPEGNRVNTQIISADDQKKYPINYLEAVINADNQIIDVKFQKKVFDTPEDALVFTDKQIPNFLYQTPISNISKCEKHIQEYFMLIRPLLPCRYTSAQTAIQNKTKQLFEQGKELGLKYMDLPWITGLYLSCGQLTGNKLIYNVKELHKNVQKEIRRIFTALKDNVEYDQETGSVTITITDSIFKNFIAAFGFTEADGYKKTSLVDNIHLESFSKIRGPFLAGVMDGSADYGISDINYGLQCQIHGLPAGNTRNIIAELARSCSLATYEENDILIIAGGMLFRIQCVNNPPKDVPGLISLSSYPNEEGQNVLLGMPMKFQLEPMPGEVEMVELEVSGRLLLSDYTVVNM